MKLLFITIILFWFGNQSVVAQEDVTYNKKTLFKWDWKTIGKDHYDQMKTNSTFKYYYPFDTHPMLKAFENNFFRKFSNGSLNVDLQFHGNKTMLVHQNGQYNELRLPLYPRYKNEEKYWDVFRIDMSLNDPPANYKVPLQLRLFMDNKTENKVEITIKNDGTIVFSAENSDKEQTIVFYAGDKIDITKRFLVEYRLSNKGEFVVFVDDKEHFRKTIPSNFFHDGSTNGVWFEGKTTLYALNQEQWHSSSNFGVSDFNLNMQSNQIAINFKKIADLFNGQKLKLSSSSQMNFKKGSFKKDSTLTNPYVTFAIRRSFYFDKNEKMKINYKVGLYVFGTIDSSNNKTEKITFPVVYEFNFPKDDHDYDDWTVDPNYEYKIYTTDIKNPIEIERNELRN